MSYWLIKSEPEEYSYQDLVRDGRTVWDGVRNPQAQKHLRAMKVGDLALYYHTGKEKAVVGIARITREAFPDPTDPTYMAVEVAPVRELPRAVPLTAYKAEPAWADFALVRQGRLSVMPVPAPIWDWTLRQAGLSESIEGML